ncbi:hypothetical protein DVR12_02120 [Chitinophaga silvatica]|uniref:Uncharacterized protein n=1 Tax=Chitinophaga silvatica TaxID=2282649 RepID=A0A3E1YGQ9_9BACT|nr:hypothetical protein [Chitinophaga silvatica]RFS26605.1 hypothetical protein DVR12_02120 [Chitinophaga silvatica]
MNKLLLAGAIALFCSATLMSCLPGRKHAPGGVAGLPERPKLPDNEYPTAGTMHLPEGFETGNAAFPFAVNYITLPVKGESKEFVFISLPNNYSDSLAGKLANNYQNIAGTLIDQWAGRNTGIMVDLRTNGKKSAKADFIVNSAKGSFPVILVWDATSIERLPLYVSMLKSVPGIQVPDSVVVNDTDLQILPDSHLTYDRLLLDEYPAIKDCFR